MAALKFLRLVGGAITEVFGLQTSAGAADAGKIVSLDDTGRISSTMMPVGVAADVAMITTSEALAAGDWVNVWNSTGAKVRKADATVSGKQAHGFVLAAATLGAQAMVYFEGTNTAVTGQTPGDVYLQTSAGLGGSTIPNASGNVVQRLGVATSATSVNFEPQPEVVLA